MTHKIITYMVWDDVKIYHDSMKVLKCLNQLNLHSIYLCVAENDSRFGSEDVDIERHYLFYIICDCTMILLCQQMYLDHSAEVE